MCPLYLWCLLFSSCLGCLFGGTKMLQDAKGTCGTFTRVHQEMAMVIHHCSVSMTLFHLRTIRRLQKPSLGQSWHLYWKWGLLLEKDPKIRTSQLCSKESLKLPVHHLFTSKPNFICFSQFQKCFVFISRKLIFH